jgi:tRNA uridine 5-carboxymethylaminomethyl modification enzyme
METLEGVRQNEAWKIPVDLDYGSIPGISNEIRERLTKTRPETLGQASRLPGITPASVATLLIYLKMNAKKGREAVL